MSAKELQKFKKKVIRKMVRLSKKIGLTVYTIDTRKLLVLVLKLTSQVDKKLVYFIDNSLLKHYDFFMSYEKEEVEHMIDKFYAESVTK